MNSIEFTQKLKDLSACSDAKKFALNKSLEEVWQQCERGDWMLWLAKKTNIDIRKLTKAKALCANTVRHLMKDERSKNAIDVAIRFGDGLAELSELKVAADAAYDADAAAAAAAYAAYDADAAAYAADAAVAAYAADAAVAAADAAAAAYAAYAAVAAYAADAAVAAYAAAAAYAADAYDADAAAAAAYAAYAAAVRKNARRENQLLTASIVREQISYDLILKHLTIN